MANYFMGIDISTTGSKVLLIDDLGNVVGQHTSPHTLQTPKPLWSEQDPKEWMKAVTESIRAVVQKSKINAKYIRSIGLTGQMHGLVLLDENGDVLRPAILWNDQRTQEQCDEILDLVGRRKFIEITGNVPLTGFTAPKILWVAENESHIYKQIKHILLPKDYIRLFLTGEFAMDKAGSSGTVLFNLKQRNWATDILTTLNINPSWLPQTFEGPDVTGHITQSIAELTGLQAGTPVVAGGGDQETQAIGVGAVVPGVLSLTLGTSGVIFATTPSALNDEEGRLHAFCHAVPGVWHLMGVMLSAAGSLQWYRDTLASDTNFSDLVNEAETVSAGSEGLIFLPYLMGERTPYPDPKARAAFIGLTIRHGRPHMTRAILEGVAFGLKDVLSLMRSSGLQQDVQIRISGGGTKSSTWNQILASILESELVTVNETEGAAYGAAILAGVSQQAWPDVQTACQELIRITGRIMPVETDFNIYRHQYSIYRDFYPALKPGFSQMA